MCSLHPNEANAHFEAKFINHLKMHMNMLKDRLIEAKIPITKIPNVEFQALGNAIVMCMTGTHFQNFMFLLLIIRYLKLTDPSPQSDSESNNDCSSNDTDSEHESDAEINLEPKNEPDTPTAASEIAPAHLVRLIDQRINAYLMHKIPGDRTAAVGSKRLHSGDIASIIVKKERHQSE